jgi:threonine dehydrogenase-like Zn-dependent dehydrogenase
MAQRETMKVLQITAPGEFTLIDMPIPHVSIAHLGLVQIKRLGIVTCNAYDLHVFQGKPYPDETGTTHFPYPAGGPGHEWVGMVNEVGPGVKGLEVGDWVCMPGGRGERGWATPAGGYAPYTLCHASLLVKVPAGLPLPKVAPLEMAACIATTMVDLVRLDAIRGKRTAVAGLGPAGLITAQLLRAEGAAEVIGIEVDEKRRAYALEKGAVDRAINPIGEDGKALPTRNRWNGAATIDVSVDCSGAPAGITYLMDHTSHIVSLFAVQHGPVEYRGWGLGLHLGLWLLGYRGRDVESGDYAARMIADGAIDLGITVSHTMRLEDYDKAIELIRTQQALKVLFTFDERDW